MNYLTVNHPRNSVGELDRLFNSVFNTIPAWTDKRPMVDIRSTEDAYLIDADLPGFTEDQIDVRVENDLLIISARDEEKKENEEKDDGYVVRERHMRSFYRSFALPKDADAGKIDAHYRNGVLTLSVNKKPESKPRKIDIKRK